MTPEVTRVYVWRAPVRLTHWLIAGSMLVLAVTGIYIGDPFIIVEGPATQRFVMGTMRVIHLYAAIVFTLSVLARLLWMLFDRGYGRWDEFLPVARRRQRGLLRSVQFYLFLRREPPNAVGHNPLAGLAYLAVFGLYLVEIVTGLALYGASAHVESPLRIFAGLAPFLGGLQVARWIHHVVMWLLIGFVVHHVYSALLIAHVEKNGTLESIFSGYKYFPKDRLANLRYPVRHRKRKRPA